MFGVYMRIFSIQYIFFTHHPTPDSMHAFCHTCVENPLKGHGKGMLKATALVYDPQGIALLLPLIAKQFIKKHVILKSHGIRDFQRHTEDLKILDFITF